jgi:hypothetical protein
MDAAFMSLELHERGIHVVCSALAKCCPDTDRRDGNPAWLSLLPESVAVPIRRRSFVF